MVDSIRELNWQPEILVVANIGPLLHEYMEFNLVVGVRASWSPRDTCTG